ncbi:MAG: asparaginase [bacterium]|nr:asparaginase [bacterium]
MEKYQHEIAAKVYRGDGIEAMHYASIAVVNSEGKLTHYLGNPELVTMARSSIKPFQLLPLITSGAAERFAFQPKQLAIMCGSHSGTNDHKALVKFNLDAIRCSVSDLKCGAHRPIFMEDAGTYPEKGEDQDPLRHNCSGKHSGFLALAKHLDVDPAEYLNSDSEGQKLVRQAIADYCEVDADRMQHGVDGCSAPNFSLPICKLANAFRKLASGEGADDSTKAAISRIRGAICAFPEMVSGEGRFDLDLMRSFPDNIVCKVGGEAIEAIGLSDPRIGIAIKVHDGSFRALGAICVEALQQLGIVNYLSYFPHLKRHAEPEVKNSAGLITGSIKAEFELKKA